MMSLSPVPRAAEQLLVSAGRAGAVLGQCWAGVKLGCDLRLLSPRYLTGHKCSGSCGSEGFCGFKGFLQHFPHPDVASGNPCPHPADWDGQSMKISFGAGIQGSPNQCQSRSPGMHRAWQSAPAASLAGFVPSLCQIPAWFGLEAALQVILFHPCHGTGQRSPEFSNSFKMLLESDSTEQSAVPHSSISQSLIPLELIPPASCRASPGLEPGEKGSDSLRVLLPSRHKSLPPAW